MPVALFRKKTRKLDPVVLYSLDLVSKDNFTEEYKNKLMAKKLGIESLVEIDNNYLILLSRLSGTDCTFEQ